LTAWMRGARSRRCSRRKAVPNQSGYVPYCNSSVSPNSHVEPEDGRVEHGKRVGRKVGGHSRLPQPLARPEAKEPLEHTRWQKKKVKKVRPHLCGTYSWVLPVHYHSPTAHFALAPPRLVWSASTIQLPCICQMPVLLTPRTVPSISVFTLPTTPDFPGLIMCQDSELPPCT
jgi:hypothetical protein